MFDKLLMIAWLIACLGFFSSNASAQGGLSVLEEKIQGYAADWVAYDSRLPKKYSVQMHVDAVIPAPPESREPLQFEEFEENQLICRDRTNDLLFESRSRTYFPPGRQTVKFWCAMQQCRMDGKLFERWTLDRLRGLTDWTAVESLSKGSVCCPRLEPLLLPAAATYFFTEIGASHDSFAQMFTLPKLMSVKSVDHGLSGTWMTEDNHPWRFRTYVVFDSRVGNLPTEFRVTMHDKKLSQAEVLQDSGYLVNHCRTVWKEFEKGLWLPTSVDCIANGGLAKESDNSHYQFTLIWSLNADPPPEVVQELQAIKRLGK